MSRFAALRRARGAPQDRDREVRARLAQNTPTAPAISATLGLKAGDLTATETLQPQLDATWWLLEGRPKYTLTNGTGNIAAGGVALAQVTVPRASVLLGLELDLGQVTVAGTLRLLSVRFDYALPGPVIVAFQGTVSNLSGTAALARHFFVPQLPSRPFVFQTGVILSAAFENTGAVATVVQPGIIALLADISAS